MNETMWIGDWKYTSLTSTFDATRTLKTTDLRPSVTVPLLPHIMHVSSQYDLSMSPVEMHGLEEAKHKQTNHK